MNFATQELIVVLMANILGLISGDLRGPRAKSLAIYFSGLGF